MNVKKSDIPVIHNIDSAILAEVERNSALFCMAHWHSELDRDGEHYTTICGTIHCRAGWAIALAGQKGRALEREMGTPEAARMIYRKSRNGVSAPNFYTCDDSALADIRACAAHEQQYDAAVLEDKERTRIARNLARRQARAQAKKLMAEALQTAARDLELIEI